MSFSDLMALVLMAMNVDFSVFGFTINLYQCFVFSVFVGGAFWCIRFFIDNF